MKNQTVVELVGKSLVSNGIVKYNTKHGVNASKISGKIKRIVNDTLHLSDGKIEWSINKCFLSNFEIV